jgi:hypothetical protein
VAKKRFANINNAAIERAHLARIENYANQVDKIYKLALEEFARLAASITNINEEKLFSFKDYPQTSERINNLLRRTYSQLLATIKKGNELEWLAAAEKNDKFVNAIFRSSNLTKKQLEKYNDRNLAALKAFQNRKPDTWNRSQNVWNIKKIPDPKTGLEQSLYKSIKQFKTEIELGIDIGLGEGKSAAVLSRVLRNNLKEPEKLFRRVIDKRGNLVLSKAAEQYNPGTGVYRSSYKNAMRLTRTETNMSYRTSDHERWKQLDFVVGIEIRLSNNPNHCPTCFALAGKYPKDFKFAGWHPQCRCHAISILKTDEEIDADDIRILKGEEVSPDSVNTVSDVPVGFKKWVDENKERASQAKSTPFWIKDNFKDGDLGKGFTFKVDPEKPFITSYKKLDLTKLIKGDIPTNKEVKDILFKYAELNPDNFRIGLGEFKFLKSKSYFMQHSANYRGVDNSWVGKSTITISTNTFDRIGFNPADQLKAALGAIKKGSPLTFNQEYSIEALWHEILHAKTKTSPRNLTIGQTKSMETINQFVARHTYDDFLNTFGGKAYNKKEILERGYGYTSWINNFRDKLRASGIDESIALKELTPILLSDYRKIEFNVYKFFEKYKGL